MEAVAIRKMPWACGLAATVAVAGCGGGGGDEDWDAEPAAEADGVAVVRSIRLAGGLTERTVGMRTFQACQPAKFTASAEALLNVTVSTRVWRPGRYIARIPPFSYRYRARQESSTCKKPDGTWEVRPAYSYGDTVRFPGREVLLVFDGSHVEIHGSLLGSVPDCTGEDLLQGEDVGRANPMMTLTGNTRCAYPDFSVTTHTTVKLVGTLQ